MPVVDRILFVDDDARLLDGIRRRLRGRFAIETAVGPVRGLQLLTERPPFAVVVADMNMPGMDGATFLACVQQRSPDTVRMMLTGNTDLGTAIAAVNDGNVFRFISKPVTGDDLDRFLTAGLEQRRMVSAMRRAAAAEEASRAKSDFLATVSHELRTPLTVICSTAEILEQFADDEPREVRAEFVATIGTYARHLDGMIDQLLHLAEIDVQAPLPLANKTFDLLAVLPSAIDAVMAGDTVGPAPILAAGQGPLSCRGDATTIGRAFAQLLANARRFSPSGAPVHVEVRSAGSEVTVDVIDRGPGIPAAIADRVFESFVQCADVLIGKPAGLGLGLTIAQRIVHRHGGTIAFRAEPGGGTRFSVTLALAADQQGTP